MHPEIKVIRKTLTEIHEQAALGPNNELKLWERCFFKMLYNQNQKMLYNQKSDECDLFVLIPKMSSNFCFQNSFSIFKLKLLFVHNFKTIILSICRGEIDVTVVHFRSGFKPSHYPTQNEWDARYLIEKSAAIKCPSIHYHLAGTKKVQQALAKPGILKRFLTDDVKIKAITDTFTGLYSMDSNTEERQNALQMVLTDPSKWVNKK